MAREAGGQEGLSIGYETAAAEDLEFPDSTFDLAFYADTLEITSDLDQVLSHMVRVVRPGGIVFYDTVNRTLLSRLIYLGAFQGLPLTRIMPPGRYAAKRLRRPAELTEQLAAHGLRNEDICSFKPKNPLNLVKATLARRKGEITDEEIPPIVDFILEPAARPVVTYLGYARKP